MTASALAENSLKDVRCRATVSASQNLKLHPRIQNFLTFPQVEGI